ncbi:MAG: multidrug efflux system outer membrane protein [Gammaproteobacteria bacterium]|jgi:multidrug efflux system outer membrane protein
MNFRFILLAIVIGALIGCAAVGPNYSGPPPSNAELIANWPSAAGENAGPAIVAEEPAQTWWHQIDDAALDELMSSAVTANYDLRIAAANIEAARAILASVSTQRRPSVDVGATLEERRNSSALTVITDSHDALPGTSRGLFGANLSWEIDLFGRVRRSIEAASAELGSLEAVRNGVMVSVLAAVARAYVDLRGSQLRLDVARQNVAVQEQTLQLVDVLLEEGAATELDAARARTQLLTSRARIPSLDARARAAVNRLTTLTGQAPGALDVTVGAWQPLPELAKLPDFVAVGSPADLMRRRPDIEAAERALAATSARIGVATADLFPTVSFGASVGTGAAPLSGLIDAGAPFFALGPSITWNVFDRAGIYANIAQADSNAAANLARYEATVTRALEEVDTAISAYRNERLVRLQLSEAVGSSRLAANLARLRYREGVEDFLDVLDAERNLLIVEDQLAVSGIRVAQNLVDIHLALGGGWQALTPAAHQPYQSN